MRSVFVLVFLTFASASRPALAGDGDKAIARARYETATRLYQVREFAAALAEFKAAYVAKDDPAFLFNIAQCHRNLGNLEEAITFYRSFLARAPADDPNRPQVEARLRRTQNDVVFKDDMEPDPVDPFAPARGPAPPAPPTAAPSPPPQPAIVVQPKPLPVVAPTPRLRPVVVQAPPPPLTSGPAGPVSVRAVSLSSPKLDDGRPLRIAGITCAAAGLASMGIGIYYYTRATHYSDVVSNDRNHTAADYQAGRDAETAQWWLYSVGGAAIVGGAVLYWLGWRTPVRPVVGPGLAGVSAGGSF